MSSCEACGIEDALGRHSPYCRRARDLGLPLLADGEAPIAPDVEENDLPLEPLEPEEEGRPAQEGAQGRTGRAQSGSVCIACGVAHATKSDREIGVMRVAASCEWRLRHPGKEAHEVIEELEARVQSLAQPTPGPHSDVEF